MPKFMKDKKLDSNFWDHDTKWYKEYANTRRTEFDKEYSKEWNKLILHIARSIKQYRKVLDKLREAARNKEARVRCKEDKLLVEAGILAGDEAVWTLELNNDEILAFIIDDSA